ncbi:transport and Golgi organization protein 1 homolog isoform X2 [Girardinichthys multiradiatus]|uniref:transport and Golgi organization protein 1 homolog isoform X2 n=1 Tax=Girardinichthys multiradiatus TaxID=208333 RepID=UPI001FAD5A66|nr:transport and Golgi organization protein 1 homolog isoform X2 [Girardinichthys multiradiatus]
MTGWLGFGEEKKTITVENEEIEETGDEKEPTETFRSRRMSLDLEGSKLQEEEKEDMGTLGWLGSELSSRLGFGSSAQDSGGEGEGVKEQPASSSWMEMRIGGFWGSNTEADGSKGSVISETEKDQTLEQPSRSENVVISQALASFSEEIKAQTKKESEMKEIVNVPSTLQGSAESGDAIDHNIDNTDTKQVNVLDINTEIEVFNKGVSIHNSSLKDNTGDNRPIENVGENNIRGQRFSQNGEFTEQPEISLDSDHSLKELDSNSMEQLEGSVEKDENHHIQTKAPGSLKEEGGEVTNQVHKLEESALMSENSPVSGDDNKGKLFNEVTGLSQQEILKEESLEETQVSDDQEGSNEQGQVVFSSLETEILQGELGLQQETQPMEASSQDDGASLSGNTESLYDNVSEDDGGKISSNETTPGINKTPGFPHMENKVMQRESDADQFEETVKDQNELTEKEKSSFEEEARDESKLKLTVGSERETESPEGLKEDVTKMKKEDVKEVKELIKELKQEGQQRKLEDIHKNEIEKEEEMVNVSRDGRGLRKERQKEAEELEEGEKMETALLKNEQAKMIRLKESEEPNEKEQEEKMAEVSGESLSDKEMELIGEREKDPKKLNEKDKHVEELLEHGNQIRVEELKESEEQNVKEEKADVSGGKEVEMELKEERQKKIEELKEDTELPEHEQARVERLKESGEPNKKEQKEEKMGEVSGESLSDKEMEIRGERQKDAKKLNEKDKHVEELLEHGNQIRVEELKESEKQNKKEEKAEVSWEREETELQKEMEKELEDQKDEENQETELLEHEQGTLERLEEFEEPNGKKKGGKEKKTGVFGESNKEEGKEFREQEQKEDDDSKEKMVKEFVKYENRVRVEELKAYEEQNKEEKKENEEQVQEGQLEDNKTDIWRPEFEDFEKEPVDNSSLASLVPETNTEIQREEEEKEVEKQKKNELDKEKEHVMKGVEVNNIDVGGSEDGEWTGKLNDDGNWKEDSDNSNFEEEIRKTDATKTGNEFHRDRGEDKTYHSAESQVQISEQTKSTHPPQGTESESKGDLGLFKNTLGFFSQMPIPVMTESIQSDQNFQTNSPETSQPCRSFSPELDSSTDSLHPEATHTAFPPEQLQPHPISAKNLNYNDPSVTEAPSKTKTLNKHYKNLHHHMNAGEVVILQDLFGRHKLQFLDYILTSLDAMTAEEDQSILSDIERLLQHHMEMLDAPSMSITDVPQEDKQRTSAISALQKLGTLLKTVKETISTGISDVSNHQAGHSSSQTKDEEDNSQPLSLREDDGGNVKDWNYVEEERRDTGSKDKMASLHHTQPGSQQKGLIKPTLEFIHRVAEDSIIYTHAVMEILVWIIVQAVSLLPDDMRPGPDLYGIPWEPIIFTGLMGLVTFLLFTCRCYRSIKSRLYQRNEHRMAEQVAQLLDEKCKVLETLSQCQQEYDDLENLLRDSGVLAQTQKSEHLEVQASQLEQTKKQLGTDLEHLKDQLAQQQERRKEQERKITLLEESMKACEEETKELHSKEEQAQTTLKIYSMSSDRLQRNLEMAEEENTVLQESNCQLKQEVEGWAERVSELEAEMRRCEVAHSAMMQDVAIKDERITSLTDRLLRMKCWDSDLEDEEGGEKETTNGSSGKEEDTHLQKVQNLIFAAKLNADLKSVDEDKDRVFAKLNDEIKAKEDLQVSIEEMEKEKLSLESDSENYTDQVERIQQKLQIMTEMYQENELKLHRMLTVEEKERHQKEEKLSKADKNIEMAMEELNNYRKRAEEMEEELEKTKQSYQTQISAHEKKAHNNWLAFRSAERELGDIRRENALIRQKLTDTQFKLDSLDKDPYALNNLARPLPFRAERSPYAPSPLGRPSSETRPFLSPPTLMDGPGRLSPRGYMFPEPGGPMFRRPPPPPGVLGPLPPPGALLPGTMPPRGLPLGPPHPLDMADGSFRENRLGPGDPDHRESGPGGQRTPPELDPRMGGPLPPGHPGIPIDGPYPRRALYGPPHHPDFYPPRIPGGPPMRPMWSPHPPGMILPPRFSPVGPFPPTPNPNIPYGPRMALPPSNNLPPSSIGPPPPHQQSLPSPPHRQSPENRPSPENAI